VTGNQGPDEKKLLIPIPIARYERSVARVTWKMPGQNDSSVGSNDRFRLGAAILSCSASRLYHKLRISYWTNGWAESLLPLAKIVDPMNVSPYSASDAATNCYKSIRMTYQRPPNDDSSVNSCDIEAKYDMSEQDNPGIVGNAGTTSAGYDVDYGYDAPAKTASLAEDSVDAHSTDVDEIERQQEEYEKMNTLLLARLRIIIIFGLALLMLATSSAVYAFGVSRKIASFRERFRSEAARTMDSIQSSLSRKTVALESLSTTLTTMAEIQNYSWPFVTFSNSSKLLSPYHSLLGNAVLVICPIVASEQQSQWEAYARNEMGRL
jgi:hypothetical protein